MNKSFKNLFIVLAILIITATAGYCNSKGIIDHEQMNELAVGLAFYPDQLLANILVSTTMPEEVEKAQKYLLKNNNSVDKMPSADIDPCVKNLLYTPEIINKMQEKKIAYDICSDAVIGQLDELLKVLQDIRKEALSSGKLKSNENIKVIDDNSYIKILFTKNVINIPTYDYCDINWKKDQITLNYNNYDDFNYEKKSYFFRPSNKEKISGVKWIPTPKAREAYFNKYNDYITYRSYNIVEIANNPKIDSSSANVNSAKNSPLAEKGNNTAPAENVQENNPDDLQNEGANANYQNYTIWDNNNYYPMGQTYNPEKGNFNYQFSNYNNYNSYDNYSTPVSNKDQGSYNAQIYKYNLYNKNKSSNKGINNNNNYKIYDPKLYKNNSMYNSINKNKINSAKSYDPRAGQYVNNSGTTYDPRAGQYVNNSKFIPYNINKSKSDTTFMGFGKYNSLIKNR